MSTLTDTGHHNCRDYYLPIQPSTHHTLPPALYKTKSTAQILALHASQKSPLNAPYTRQTFPFLRLPYELRRKIYSYLLPYTETKTSSGSLIAEATTGSSAASTAHKTHLASLPSAKYAKNTILWHRGQTSILSACRQLHAECSTILYGENTFVLWISYDQIQFRFRWVLASGLAPSHANIHSFRNLKFPRRPIQSPFVQEATVVIRNIFRKYPNQYESIISTLCENLDSLDEPEAKAAMIWIIGQYADRIDNSDVLLDDFLYTFADEPHEVQLALLTATVKLFIQRPKKGQELVPKVLKWATEETDNPDLRDRGYMYWRLLSSDPVAAKQVVMGEKPPITAETEKLDPFTLQEMCLVVGSLATIYLKPIKSVFRSARPRIVPESPALQKHRLPSHQAMLDAQKHWKDMTSMSGGQPRQNGNAANGDLAAAVDAADMYFSNIGTQQMANMSLNDDGYATSPITAGGAQTMFVVNQNQPQQVYQPTVGNGNGDLLSF
ncbi:putative AP-2 adaptor complex subunit beta [Aureobasidium pullulans]|nr:putative AP-2 adaptor complex subunit beta [Aureobasidium pullulans]